MTLPLSSEFPDHHKQSDHRKQNGSDFPALQTPKPQTPTAQIRSPRPCRHFYGGQSVVIWAANRSPACCGSWLKRTDKRRSASKRCGESMAPTICGVLLGGTFVLGYGLSLFLPVIQLLKDISLPGEV